MAQFHEQDDGRGSGRISHPGPTLVRRCAVRAAFCLSLPLLLLIAGCPQPAELPEEKPAAAQKPDAVNEQPPYPVVQDPETNGYHELLLAAARVREAPNFESPWPNLPLAQARAAVASLAGTETVALVRQALRKPVDYPVPDLHLNTRFPEFSDFRSIARLLAQRYRVQCTDKDWDAAEQTFETGVQLVSVIPDDFTMVLIAQGAMQHTVLSAPARQLDELPADHCRRLIQLCRHCPTGKDDVRRALHGEVDLIQRTFTDPVRAGLSPAKAATGAEPDHEVVEALEAMRAEFTGLVDLPVAERSTPRVPPHFSQQAADMMEVYLDAVPSIAGIYETRQAAHRLLQTHLRLRLHYLEHGSHPASLAELQAGELIIDPFAEKPFQYSRNGKTYSLTSVGRPLTPRKKLEGKKRMPLDLMRGKAEAENAR